LSEEKPLRIIGVGNPLLGDDGLGIVAAERLAALEWPAGVEVLDGGTGGLTLLDLFAGARALILLDAVAMGAAPGTLRRFTAAELQRLPEEAPSLSLHGGGLAEVLALARELGELPPLVLYGVEPERVEFGMGLSPPVAAALDRLLAAVRAEAGTIL
jgi:hydrogenase maturation protease